MPRAPGTGHVMWAQSPRHTGTQTEPLLRGSLAQATWRQSWGLNQCCPPGDDTQPGLGNGRTAGPGRALPAPGGLCARGTWTGHLIFPLHSSLSHTRALAGTHSGPRVHAHTHAHARTGVQSHLLTPAYTHTGVCTLTHSHAVSLQGLDTEGKQYRAGRQSRGHLF